MNINHSGGEISLNAKTSKVFDILQTTKNRISFYNRNKPRQG